MLSFLFQEYAVGGGTLHHWYSIYLNHAPIFLQEMILIPLHLTTELCRINIIL